MLPRKLASVYCTVLNYQLMINTDVKEVVMLGILVHIYSYQFIDYKIHQDKFKFTLETRVMLVRNNLPTTNPRKVYLLA